MSFDREGRRIVLLETLLVEFRLRLLANPIRNKQVDQPLSDTPKDLLLDQLSLSPPTVRVE